VQITSSESTAPQDRRRKLLKCQPTIACIPTDVVVAGTHDFTAIGRCGWR
jgi:hypothetical protein